MEARPSPHPLPLAQVGAIAFRRCRDHEGFTEFLGLVMPTNVKPLPDLVKIVRKNISKTQRNAMLNGIFVLKGGDLDAEIHNYRKNVEVLPISNWFEDQWFKEKNVIYLPL